MRFERQLAGRSEVGAMFTDLAHERAAAVGTDQLVPGSYTAHPARVTSVSWPACRLS